MGIEKLGLPAKPAAKGSAWVLDASSCQACQIPFSLFSRKHHCRRCGGLFCGNCSNSRVNLRGQSDGPVRVCEPCKKLEEAARFQARHRGKLSKGAAMGSSAAEDDTLLKEVLGDGVETRVSGVGELLGSEVEAHHGDVEVSPTKGKAVELKEENTSPEKLRELAFEQKKVYAALKREGKNAAALQAFKRHKELGREADALELAHKKLAVSQRRALAEAQAAAENPVQTSSKESPENVKKKEDQGTIGEKEVSHGLASGKKLSKDGGDEDLFKALKDLGWNEADLKEKKPKNGPASDIDLLAEISDSVPKAATTRKPLQQNPTQLEILAHKRSALALKREGKPVEAKEELKKAKILERKLEEMALLGDEDEDEDDDDELAALMRSLDKEAKAGKGKDSTLGASGGNIPLSFNLDDDDDDDETNLDVTDEDVNDPSMIAALRAMGWVEEASAMERSRMPETGGPEVFHVAASITERSSLQSEILHHKRLALTFKREGKLAEAKKELQEAKALEQKLEVVNFDKVTSEPINSSTSAPGKVRGAPMDTPMTRFEEVLQDPDDAVEVDEADMRDPQMMAALKAMGFEEDDEPSLPTLVKPSIQEKRNLQDEILSVKRSALALKKQGKAAEAREQLRQAKGLEQKLAKMQVDLEANSLPPVAIVTEGPQRKVQNPIPTFPPAGLVLADEEDEVEVSADDFMDPELVAALKSVGWQQEDTFVKDKQPEKEEEPGIPPDSPPIAVQPYRAVKLPQKEHTRKLQLQKELLAHKRKALALKREGKVEEARLELKQGKVLEKEMEEIENAALGSTEDPQKKVAQESKQPVPTSLTAASDEEDEDVTDSDMQDPELLDALKAFGWKPEPETTSVASQRNASLTPARVSRPGSLEIAKDVPRKPDVTKPPYTKNATESDPIWYAIMNSASKKHLEIQEEVSNRGDGEGPLGAEERFHGHSRDHGSSIDMVDPILDYPPSGRVEELKSAHKEPTSDLLSGGAWEAPVQNVSKEVESEDEDDVFDTGLLAALQSIGLGPSKDSSLKTFQGDTVNNKGKRKSNLIDKMEAVEPKRKPEDNPLPLQKPRAESKGVSTRGQEANLEKVGSFLVPPKATRSASSNATGASMNAASPRVDDHAWAADPLGTNTPTSIQDDIQVHKRKALALKREGKQSEAREELRQAKLLEKQLEIATQVIPEKHEPPGSISKTNSLLPTGPDKISEPLLPVKSHPASSAAQTHKEQLRQEVRQGKDRMKLQQESLAHKRRALGLRREGKVEEAEAEFELAKSLEKQMEDLDTGARPGQSSKGVVLEPSDMGMVEGLLDPQLMAALKGLGWNDGDLQRANNNQVGGSAPSLSKTTEKIVNESSKPTHPTGGRSTSSSFVTTPTEVQEDRVANKSRQQSQVTGGKRTPSGDGSTSTNKAQAERTQLEYRIKQEKVKAIELKRAGRQGEAVEVLRGAKRLEKQLLDMTS